MALPSPPHPSSPTPSHRRMPSNSSDIESGNNTPAVLRTAATDDPPDWKPTGKVAQIVALAGVAVSVTLIVNTPEEGKTHKALYTAYLTVVCLGLFTGIGLSFFSVKMKGNHTVGWVQKKLIYFTLFFVAVACSLRLFLMLPLAYVGIGMASVFAVVGAIVLYLWFGTRRGRRRDEPSATRLVQV